MATARGNAVFCLALLLVGSIATAAETYPTKPIRFVTPYAAGGGADLIARTLGQKLSELLGQPVVVDNRPGAGATVGADIVAKSPPDGYTILLADTSHAIGASLYKRLPYDAVRDFAAVSQVVSGANILVVNPAMPANSVKELIAYAKSRPAELNYGSAGNGSPGHLAVELFKRMAGVDIVHIPYKGAAPATADLLSGRVHLMSGGMSAAVPHVRSGKLRALAVTSRKRSPAVPDVPTVAESGLPGYDVSTWFGVLAPSQSAAHAVSKLNAAIIELLKGADVRERFSPLGLEPAGSTPGEFGAHVRSEVVKWRKVVRDAGLRVD